MYSVISDLLLKQHGPRLIGSDDWKFWGRLPSTIGADHRPAKLVRDVVARGTSDLHSSAAIREKPCLQPNISMDFSVWLTFASYEREAELFRALLRKSGGDGSQFRGQKLTAAPENSVRGRQQLGSLPCNWYCGIVPQRYSGPESTSGRQPVQNGGEK
ncbi:hypothetical protein QTL95_17090 [Rhizobium sp. S152]|uniref:hypothetical protein n=1 Tax=Rhizobium sp. S152 TaxID=3055038 RepID=UPI0025AA24C2|nr:hypothetical protein [Rhizobium sp. S152]MDM9627620.1 hypothetical protein [Rhizobium sp. S152]